MIIFIIVDLSRGHMALSGLLSGHDSALIIGWALLNSII